MTRHVVDTSALIALLYPDEEYNERAATVLQETAAQGALLVNPVVYAELAADPYFQSTGELDAFLDDTGIALEGIPQAALFAAGASFRSYLDRRGEKLQCPECGDRCVATCTECSADITARQHIASDFIIGAHAETADGLVTFDGGFFRDYFDVECIRLTSSTD